LPQKFEDKNELENGFGDLPKKPFEERDKEKKTSHDIKHARNTKVNDLKRSISKQT